MKWKKLRKNAPQDHMNMLHMYKRAGIEPIKLAKYEPLSLFFLMEILLNVC